MVFLITCRLQGRWRCFDGNCQGTGGATCMSYYFAVGEGRITRNAGWLQQSNPWLCLWDQSSTWSAALKTQPVQPPVAGLILARVNDTALGKDLHGNSARYLQLKYPILAIKLMSRKAMMCSRKLLNMSVLWFLRKMDKEIHLDLKKGGCNCQHLMHPSIKKLWIGVDMCLLYRKPVASLNCTMCRCCFG